MRHEGCRECGEIVVGRQDLKCPGKEKIETRVNENELDVLRC
jgi:hypothetical protein